jgi:hypothetical protein
MLSNALASLGHVRAALLTFLVCSTLLWATTTVKALCVPVLQTQCQMDEPSWWYDGPATCQAADPPCGAFIGGGDWSTVGCSGDELKWKGGADCESGELD